MLFRYNGATELFDNGVNLGAQGSFPATIGLRHVTMDLSFNSFADGTAVSMVANVDGTEVFNGGGFTWSFTSDAGRAIQEAGGFKLADQFGAYDIAADALIEAVRQRAR